MTRARLKHGRRGARRADEVKPAVVGRAQHYLRGCRASACHIRSTMSLHCPDGLGKAGARLMLIQGGCSRPKQVTRQVWYVGAHDDSLRDIREPCPGACLESGRVRLYATPSGL